MRFYRVVPAQHLERVLGRIEEAMGNRPNDEPIPLDSIDAGERSGSGSSSFPWWGFFAFVVFVRMCASLDSSRTTDSSRGRELLEQQRQEQQRRQEELQAAESNPERYGEMELDVLLEGARLNLPEAQWELGRRYLEGDGVEVDLPAGRMWLSLAAVRGHEAARQRLEALETENPPQ